MLLGGGVVANTRLRERMEPRRASAGIRVLVPVRCAVHGQRGDDRVRGGGQIARGERTSLDIGADPQPKVGAVTTVLVTGGAGFIGSHLADRLLAEGHRVISVDDLTTGRIANLADARGYGKEFTFFNMDVRAEGLLVPVRAASAGGGVPPRGPVRRAPVARRSRLVTPINVMGTINVLECAAKVGVRKVIYAASGGTIYGEPKRIPAKEIRRAGLASRSARTASRRRWSWTTWASTSAIAASTTRRWRWATSTGPGRTPTARPA